MVNRSQCFSIIFSAHSLAKEWQSWTRKSNIQDRCFYKLLNTYIVEGNFYIFRNSETISAWATEVFAWNSFPHPNELVLETDDAEKSPVSRTVLEGSWWHLHNKKKESLRSASVWYRPNTLRRLNQNYSHYSRVLERVKSCVPFFVRALGIYSSRAWPLFLGVEVFSL